MVVSPTSKTMLGVYVNCSISFCQKAFLRSERKKLVIRTVIVASFG
jgi:hypothetical protein